MPTDDAISVVESADSLRVIADAPDGSRFFFVKVVGPHGATVVGGVMSIEPNDLALVDDHAEENNTPFFVALRDSAVGKVITAVYGPDHADPVKVIDFHEMSRREALKLVSTQVDRLAQEAS